VKEDSVVECRNPGIALPVADAFTEVFAKRARELLQQAVEAEVVEFVRHHRELKDEDERQRVVRNGYRPQRKIQTGVGEVAVKAPRARDRGWGHKTANVLNNLPEGRQAKAKAGLHEIWMAESRAAAEQAFDHFVTTYK
jgi:transposase-like protein